MELKTKRFFGLILILVMSVTLSGMSGISPPFLNNAPTENAFPPALKGLSPTSSSHCPPLSAPIGNIVNVSTVAELQSAVNSATSGDTILVANGTYNLNGVYLQFDVPNVTLRSASGNREAVILDGNYLTTEIVQIIASNVTIADLTLQEAYYHPIHVSTDGSDTVGTLIYNVHIIDPREQAIKINPGISGGYPDNGIVACSHIELTDTGRPNVNPIEGGCYTGGVDAHQARDWGIRDNLIEGFWCPTGLSEHGIHLWRGSRDTVVERNELVNNARGVGFGLETSGTARTYADNPCPTASGYVGHYGGIIRNNFIFANDSGLFTSGEGFDSGIALWQVCGARALHNTVASTTDPRASSIEWRFWNTDVDIINNLVTHNLVERDGATAFLSGNLQNQPLSLFVDGAGGDLHLVSTATVAIDQVTAPTDVSDDFDGNSRPIGTSSDIGADEYGVPPPSAVTSLRVTNAVTGTGVLTATLSWIAPTNAVTYTMRYSNAWITQANWGSAIDVTVPFTAATAGSTEWLTTTVPYTDGDTAYFALKSQNAGGDWSGLSNNAFWPHIDIYLPFVLKEN